MMLCPPRKDVEREGRKHVALVETLFHGEPARVFTVIEPHARYR